MKNTQILEKDLRNEFFSAEHSGSRNKAPWANLKFFKKRIKENSP